MRSAAEEVKHDLRRSDVTVVSGFLNRVRRFESFRGRAKVLVKDHVPELVATVVHPVVHPWLVGARQLGEVADQDVEVTVRLRAAETHGVADRLVYRATSYYTQSVAVDVMLR